jgi:hypothetical protein
MGAARRILAILECRPTDDDVVRRAAELASAGGYLTIVAVAPRPSPFIYAGPLCPAQRVTPEELVEHAQRSLARAVALVPPDVAVLTHVEQGNVLVVAKRRAAAAACDLVVVRPRLARRLRARVAPAGIDISAPLGQNSRIRTLILKPKEA